MKILWDEKKRKINLEKHGLDFAELTLEFFDKATFLPTHSNRLKAISIFNNRILTVVIKPYGSEAISIISMRPANKKREQYR